MTNPIRTAATLATTLALTAAVVSAGPAATPAGHALPESAVAAGIRAQAGRDGFR